MRRYDCDAVRDLLPALVRGELRPQERADAEAHVQACADCREELGVVRLVQSALAPLPASLEARVLLAVRAAPLAQRRAVSGKRLALAAAIAAAVIGGSAVFIALTQRTGGPLVRDASQFSWAAAEDPMLHGQSQLQELTEEELEIVLAELDS